jgi:hypothetical protein
MASEHPIYKEQNNPYCDISTAFIFPRYRISNVIAMYFLFSFTALTEKIMS